MALPESDLALIREFVYTAGRMPAMVTRSDDGTTVFLTLRPVMSSRTLRIVATVTAVVEL